MTDHDEDDRVRALFQGADLEHVPTARDLIGPAVAWGAGRRRRDRWTAAGISGAVAAVAVAGIFALRPGGGGPEAVAPGRVKPAQTSAKPTPKPAMTPTKTATLPKLSGSYSQREQELLDALKPYLPAGVGITCQDYNRNDGFCTVMVLTGPTGTSELQWNTGEYDWQAAPVDSKYVHQHVATTEIPLVSGTIGVPEGTVKIISTDTEAQDNVGDKTTLTDPTAPVFHTAVYQFTPSGVAGVTVSIEQSELVREMPTKPGSEIPDSHAIWGFNKTGPVLSPQQFANLAAAPLFAQALNQLQTLEMQAAQDRQRTSQHGQTGSSTH